MLKSSLNLSLERQFHLLGDSLLHMSASMKNESAGLFLIDHGAQVNHSNKRGESPLHTAAQIGLVALVNKLLRRYGAYFCEARYIHFKVFCQAIALGQRRKQRIIERRAI